VISAVVGYHLNPERCGVARFNVELARRLDVPFVGIQHGWGAHPLLSLKWSELDLRSKLACLDKCDQPYSVLWHDEGNQELSFDAQRVLSAVTDLWCPPLVSPVSLPPVDVTLFTFGMGSKIQSEPYRKVKQLLDDAGLTFRLKVSVALHEGTSLEDVSMHFDALDQVLGPENVQVLGCLSDSALAEQMQAADVICAFFPNGVRANNTSVHGAMAMGKPVITNRGSETPILFAHGQSILDIHHLDRWPSPRALQYVAQFGAQTHALYYSWHRFIPQLKDALYAQSDHRQYANR
jgi:hypothetical protein